LAGKNPTFHGKKIRAKQKTPILLKKRHFKLEKEEQGWAAEGEERAKLPSPEDLPILPILPKLCKSFF